MLSLCLQLPRFMAIRVPSIDLKWVVSGPDPYHPWTGFQGRFNHLTLGLMAPDYLLGDVFCCGPEPFMQTVREGLNIPFGCTVGLCGTCKVTKLAGNVDMVHDGGISADDIAA